MEYGSIERELHIDASPEIVFDVVTNPDHIHEWWDATTDFKLEPAATSRFAWATADEQHGAHSTPFTVVEVDPPRLFSFRWTYDEGTAVGPGTSLLVTFELVPAGEGTTLRFRETGFRERGWEGAALEENYARHQTGWDLYLPRLVDVANRAAVANDPAARP